VVSHGHRLDSENPPASVFQIAAGNAGYRIFGLVMWSAAITSVVGSAYTSVSFLRTLSRSIAAHDRAVTVGFVLVSAAIFLSVGKPVTILILAGAVNGLILPLSLTIMLVAAYRRSLIGDYRHPVWLTACGVLVVAVMTYLGAVTVASELPKLLQ
jgi:Mn2+/Fe2+ NRAMP family transporter